MKINLKTISLVVFLGVLFYVLSNNKIKNNKQQIVEIKKEDYKLIDKKSSKLPAPKPYIYVPAQNRLGIGNDWKSK